MKWEEKRKKVEREDKKTKWTKNRDMVGKKGKWEAKKDDFVVLICEAVDGTIYTTGAAFILTKLPPPPQKKKKKFKIDIYITK